MSARQDVLDEGFENGLRTAVLLSIADPQRWAELVEKYKPADKEN